jgi:hypothetical protein
MRPSRPSARRASRGRAAFDIGQEVVRAGLGAVGAAGEQAGKLFHALVDRGAKVEEMVVEQVKETVGTVKDKVATCAAASRRGSSTWSAA